MFKTAFNSLKRRVCYQSMQWQLLLGDNLKYCLSKNYFSNREKLKEITLDMKIIPSLLLMYTAALVQVHVCKISNTSACKYSTLA